MNYLSPATGKDLDRIACLYGFKRKKYFWIFKESDKSFRIRLLSWLKGNNG